MAGTPPDDTLPSAVPDVLASGLRCVFCGINPGRVSAAAAAHFANPRNDFWRLLHDAGLTPGLLEPSRQFDLLSLGLGATNAAYRTTPGSGDLRRGDFDRERLERVADELEPRAVAFVGKEAYRGLFGERPELGPQWRTLGSTGLFVLPSTSPANAAVPYAERLRWFEALRDWLVPERREAVRALLVDARDRVLLAQFRNPRTGATWWATPGGGIEQGEDHEAALRRELREELGLDAFDLGALLWVHDRTFPWDLRLLNQRSHVYLVLVAAHEPNPTIDLEEENVAGFRWWTLDELERTTERITPLGMIGHIRAALEPSRP
ncbi:MAG TPA: NUDIX domain-containing protein [Gaiellaceae bacterium]|nr:NUDIX domain-containing protein [Gaiellaceae bacterium]